jgi:hypothetical protein
LRGCFASEVESGALKVVTFKMYRQYRSLKVMTFSCERGRSSKEGGDLRRARRTGLNEATRVQMSVLARDF